MKTAMQQLLQIVNNNIKNAHILKNNGLNNVDDINTLISTYNYFKIIIERDMLEKEKEQSKKDYHNGQMSIVNIFKDKLKIIGVYDALTTDLEDAEDYYNETYNQNK